MNAREPETLFAAAVIVAAVRVTHKHSHFVAVNK